MSIGGYGTSMTASRAHMEIRAAGIVPDADQETSDLHYMELTPNFVDGLRVQAAV